MTPFAYLLLGIVVVFVVATLVCVFCMCCVASKESRAEEKRFLHTEPQNATHITEEEKHNDD